MSRQQILEVLEQLADANEGWLLPAAVVDAARPRNSALHRYFTWDDQEAAERHRIAEARVLIRSVAVRFVEGDDAFIIRRWLPAQAVTGSVHEPGYYRETDVRADPVSREIMLRSMRREWVIFKDRYEHLAEFWETVTGAEVAAS